MSLNLKAVIKNDDGKLIYDMEFPQIETTNLFEIIGEDTDVDCQIDNLIKYFEKHPNYHCSFLNGARGLKILKGTNNLEFYFVERKHNES